MEYVYLFSLPPLLVQVGLLLVEDEAGVVVGLQLPVQYSTANCVHNSYCLLKGGGEFTRLEVYDFIRWPGLLSYTLLIEITAH